MCIRNAMLQPIIFTLHDMNVVSPAYATATGFNPRSRDVTAV